MNLRILAAACVVVMGLGVSACDDASGDDGGSGGSSAGGSGTGGSGTGGSGTGGSGTGGSGTGGSGAGSCEVPAAIHSCYIPATAPAGSCTEYYTAPGIGEAGCHQVSAAGVFTDGAACPSADLLGCCVVAVGGAPYNSSCYYGVAGSGAPFESGCAQGGGTWCTR